MSATLISWWKPAHDTLVQWWSSLPFLDQKSPNKVTEVKASFDDNGLAVFFTPIVVSAENNEAPQKQRTTTSLQIVSDFLVSPFKAVKKKVSRDAIKKPVEFRHVSHLEPTTSLDDLEQHMANINLRKRRLPKLKNVMKRTSLTPSQVSQIWLNDILPSFSTTRHHSNTKKLTHRGIPADIRAQVWSRAIGNNLHITPELFAIFHAHAQSTASKLHHTRTISTTASFTSDGDGAPLIQSCPNPSPLHSVTELDDASIAPPPTTLSLSKRSMYGHENSVALIPVDLPRTLSLSQSRFTLRTVSAPVPDSHGPEKMAKMQAVLEAYTCFRPDVGYVQGMSYVACVLCGVGMDTFEMFVALTNLLHRPCLRAMYSMQVDKMQPYMDVFEKLMGEEIPELSVHLKTLDFPCQLYLHEWLLTVFANVLPASVTYRIWDGFVMEGDVHLFRSALALLKLLSPWLLNRSFDEIARMLTRGHSGIARFVNEKRFFKQLKRIKLSSRKFDQLLNLPSS